MIQSTIIADRIRLKNAKLKAERLCKLYNCSLIDLIVMSIDKQAEIRQSEQLKSTKLN